MNRKQKLDILCLALLLIVTLWIELFSGWKNSGKIVWGLSAAFLALSPVVDFIREGKKKKEEGRIV